MSLAGLLPPLCDEQFSMLVDGGYMDNLPVRLVYFSSKLQLNVDFG